MISLYTMFEGPGKAVRLVPKGENWASTYSQNIKTGVKDFMPIKYKSAMSINSGRKHTPITRYSKSTLK